MSIWGNLCAPQRRTAGVVGLLSARLADQFGPTVSLAEAALLALKERAVGLDRVAARHNELLQTRVASSGRTRKRPASHQMLSVAEWDVLADCVQIATDGDRGQPPWLRAAVPSRESFLALLDGLDAVYQHLNEHDFSHAWDYFRGHAMPGRLCDISGIKPC